MILERYNDIIQAKVASGVIEQMFELVLAKKCPLPTSYGCCSCGIRNNQGEDSAKCLLQREKSGTSLNDCLHVGPAITPLTLTYFCTSERTTLL